MRSSKRDRIITGALELAHRDGFDALTFEALAEHVGLTRGGVVYHFRTKTELLEGIASAFFERWRDEALDALGKPLEEASRSERIEALTRSVVDGEILPGEISFMLSATPEAERLEEAWDTLRHEWVGDVSELTSMQRVALLAVDGWWANRAVDSRSQNPDRPEIADLIVSLAAGKAPDQALDEDADKDQ
ncbi:TetR/AcrR family transcriptional regulator [Actinomyces viscosus]|uniref:Transcriptional repressor BetI n=1 Tax=Actinomyces viscosus TaxID=1656 RepID=A0A448PJ81_ACTVI|nr:TetR/AcrR family transcriptional regulator [Actinomyces viscosus]TFH51242.1 TetR/AcrR family transcriptional regulator [Actinomyces viscosus]VEI15021.1 transcriptional repressor BetI [Actinomyces viscosus]